MNFMLCASGKRYHRNRSNRTTYSDSVTTVILKLQYSKCVSQIYNKDCYDLNFAENRKGENVLEHSKTGSRTPTSGTGRGESTRGGEKDIKVEPTP
jgi:hypothetical protein